MESKSKKLDDKMLEEAMDAARTNSNYYLIISTIIFLFINTGAMTIFTGVPVYFYTHRYLCKSKGSSQFDVSCEISFVCSSKNNFGVDYIIDQKNEVKIESFITKFDLYCSKIKKSFLATGFFLGGMLGTLIYPYCITYLGLLPTGKFFFLIIFISDILMSIFQNYYSTIIFYTIASMSLQAAELSYKQYITEMSSPKERPKYLLINLLCFLLSGFFVEFVTIISNNYKYILLFSAIILFLGLLFISTFLIESIRITFINGDIEKLREDLDYIASINNSVLEFTIWKKNNLDYSKKTEAESEPFLGIVEKQENPLEEINYITIWKYDSQVKLLILFSVGSFLVNYVVYFTQVELSKQNDFYRSIFLSFVFDGIGMSIGILINHLSCLSRKNTYIILTGCLAIGFLVNGINRENNYFYIFVIMRILGQAENSNYTLFNFESFPTLTRSTAVALNRIFGKSLNLLTSPIMVIFPTLSYILGTIFCLIIIILTFIFNPKETKDLMMSQYPIELLPGHKQKYNYREYLEEDKFKDMEDGDMEEKQTLTSKV